MVWAYLNEHRSASEEPQAIHDAGKPALKEIITKKNNTWFCQGGKNKAQSMVTARQEELERRDGLDTPGARAVGVTRVGRRRNRCR